MTPRGPMSGHGLYRVLVEEAHAEQPFIQAYWAYGEHLGDALEKVCVVARANGLSNPIGREADPFDLASLESEVERSESGEVFWASGRSFFPPEEDAFELPYGVVAAASPGDDAAVDVDDVRPGYRVSEESGLFRVEVNVDRASLLGLYEELLRAFEPFRVFWYKVHGHWDGPEDAPDLLYVNEDLSSADRVLEHLVGSQPDSVENGFVTLTAYAPDGATNINISEHKQIEVLTTTTEQRERAVSVVESSGYREARPFASIDRGVYHRHYRRPGSRDRDGLIQHLLDTGFSPWSPDE